MDFSLEYTRMCFKAKEIQNWWGEIEWEIENGYKSNIKTNKRPGDFFFLINSSKEIEFEYSGDCKEPENLCMLGSRIYHCSSWCDDDVTFYINNVARLGRGGNWHGQKIIENKGFFKQAIWIPRPDQLIKILVEKGAYETDHYMPIVYFEKEILRIFMDGCYNKTWDKKRKRWKK